jgi:hypothetical protein
MLLMSERNHADRSPHLRLRLGARQNVSGLRAKLRPVMFHVAMWNDPMVLGTVVVFAQTGNFYMAARHAVALGYNLAFFAVIVGLLGWLPDRARRIGTLFVYAFLAVFTVISAIHFILYGELIGRLPFMRLSTQRWRRAQSTCPPSFDRFMSASRRWLRCR